MKTCENMWKPVKPMNQLSRRIWLSMTACSSSQGMGNECVRSSQGYSTLYCQIWHISYIIYHISYIISHIEYISDEFRQNLDLDSPVQYPQHIKIDFYMKLPSVISVDSGYWYEMVWLSYVGCHALCLCTPLSVNVHRGWNACLWWFTMLYMVLRSLLPHCLLLNWVESDVST